MGNTEKERFNIAFFGTLVVLMLQFGGVVWYASRMDSRIQNVEIHLESVDKKVHAEIERTAPMIYESKYLRESLEELKRDLKEIKQAVAKK